MRFHRLATFERTRKLGPLYWAPHHRWWWTGALFMVGAVCFAIGPVVAATAAAQTAAAIFFAGSLCFTTAAGLQYLDAAAARRNSPSDPIATAEWRAAAVQLAGTVFFNVSTFVAMDEMASLTRQERLVWAPDALGSICFLVASYIAYVTTTGNKLPRPAHGLETQVAALNLAGSIAFGFSAVASYIVPDTGELINAAASSVWTLAGALCFFAGAYLIWLLATSEPDRQYDPAESASQRAT